MRPLALLAALVALVAAGVLAVAADASATGQSWGPETPNFNLEVILRASGGGSGFGHVKFRQPNDAERIIYLDTWVRGLAPNHDYLLQRAVDPINVVDGTCGDSSGWLTLGQGMAMPPQRITTDDNGTGSAALFRNVPVAPGSAFDIHFRVVDAADTTHVVLESACYQYRLSL